MRTILTSPHYTRLGFAIGSAGLMQAALSQAALSQALHYADHRCAFGTPLSGLPVQAPRARRPGPGVGRCHRVRPAALSAPGPGGAPA